MSTLRYASTPAELLAYLEAPAATDWLTFTHVGIRGPRGGLRSVAVIIHRKGALERVEVYAPSRSTVSGVSALATGAHRRTYRDLTKLPDVAQEVFTL